MESSKPSETTRVGAAEKLLGCSFWAGLAGIMLTGFTTFGLYLVALSVLGCISGMTAALAATPQLARVRKH
jgi:hypothetical protein